MSTIPRLLVASALGLAVAASPALADRAVARHYRFTPPEGLTYDESLSISLARDLSGARHYDGLQTELGAEAYTATDGLAFYVLWVDATEPTRDAALAVRRTFDQLRQAPVDKTSVVSSAEMVSWTERVEQDLAVGELQWRHFSNETITRVRATMFVTDDRLLRQVRGECVMRATAVDELSPRCDAALAALQVEASGRGSLAALPSAGTLRLSDPEEGDQMLLVVESGIDAGASSHASLRPPSADAVPYERPAPRQRANNDTILYLGGAILLVIAVYVLTRRAGGQDQDRE